MDICDFSRSFITFVGKRFTNSARIQVESRCELTDGQGQSLGEFFLVASCKSEETYAAENLFKVPNYDFCAIFSADEYQIIRTHITWDLAAAEAGVLVRTTYEPTDRAALESSVIADRFE